MTSYALAHEGLSLANLSRKTIKTLREAYPPFYLIGNPIDLTGSVQAQDFIVGFETLLADSNVDTIILIAIPAPALDVQALIEGIHPIVSEAEKTIIGLSFGGAEAEIITNKLEKLGIPTYSEEYRAVRALNVYTEYALNQNKDANPI